MPFQQFEGLGGFEPRHQDDASPRENGLPRCHEGPRVVKGTGNQRSPRRLERWRGGFGVGQCGLGRDDQLGSPGTPTRCHGPSRFGDHFRERRIVELFGRLEALGVGGSIPETSRSGSCNQRGIGQFDNGLKFDLGQLRGDRIGCRPEFPSRQATLEKLGPVGQCDRNPVARAYPIGLVNPRATVGPAVQFRAGHGSALENEGRGIGIAIRQPTHRPSEGHLGHPGLRLLKRLPNALQGAGRVHREEQSLSIPGDHEMSIGQKERFEGFPRSRRKDLRRRMHPPSGIRRPGSREIFS